MDGADVGVVQHAGRLGLAQKPPMRQRSGRAWSSASRRRAPAAKRLDQIAVGDQLDGDFAAQPRIHRPVNIAHAPEPIGSRILYGPNCVPCDIVMRSGQEKTEDVPVVARSLPASSAFRTQRVRNVLFGRWMLTVLLGSTAVREGQATSGGGNRDQSRQGRLSVAQDVSPGLSNERC